MTKLLRKTSLIGGYDLYSQLDPYGSQTVTSKGFKSRILCFEEKNTAPEVKLRAQRKSIYPLHFFGQFSFNYQHVNLKKGRYITLLTRKFASAPEVDLCTAENRIFLVKSHQV